MLSSEREIVWQIMRKDKITHRHRHHPTDSNGITKMLFTDTEEKQEP